MTHEREVDDVVERAHNRVKKASDAVELLVAKNPRSKLAMACDELLNAIAGEAVARACAPSIEATGVTRLSDEVGRLREALIDDPNDVAAGVPESWIDAGMAVQAKIEDDLQNYVSGVTTDWDEGMAVAAIFKAMLRAALRIQAESKTS